MVGEAGGEAELWDFVFSFSFKCPLLIEAIIISTRAEATGCPSKSSPPFLLSLRPEHSFLLPFSLGVARRPSGPHGSKKDGAPLDLAVRSPRALLPALLPHPPPAPFSLGAGGRQGRTVTSPGYGAEPAEPPQNLARACKGCVTAS